MHWGAASRAFELENQWRRGLFGFRKEMPNYDALVMRNWRMEELCNRTNQKSFVYTLRQSISMVQLGRTLEIPPNEFLFSSVTWPVTLHLRHLVAAWACLFLVDLVRHLKTGRLSKAVSSCARNEAWSMGLNLVSEGSHRCGINETWRNIAGHLSLLMTCYDWKDDWEHC